MCCGYDLSSRTSALTTGQAGITLQRAELGSLAYQGENQDGAWAGG